VNWFAGNHSRLLRNESKPARWLDVRVVGRRMNRMGIGAQVELFSAGRIGNKRALLGFQEIGTGYGYASGQPAVAHFGLSGVGEVDMRVHLPGGRTVDRTAVRADQLITIEEP
jgi:hypothetical protein